MEESTVTEKRSEVKHVAEIVGEWGKWQFNYFAHAFVLLAAAAINNMGFTFMGFNNKHWCSDVPPEHQNLTDDLKCHKYSNQNESCDHWQYDRSVFYNSITTQFDLVCDRSYFAAFTQSAFGIGYIFTGTVLAHYSDRYGRRPIAWISWVIDIISMAVAAIAPNVWVYIVARFFSGLGHSGRALAVYTILLEICGPKYRSDIMIMSGVGWVLGYMFLPGLAYWVQDYRYLHVSSVVSMVVMLAWFYFLDESPRWQLCNGHTDGAKRTLRKALKINGLSDDKLDEQMKQLTEYLNREQSEDEAKRRTYSFLDLFRTPNIRKRVFTMWYMFSCNALVYYAFSYNIGDYGGNFYITFMLSGLVELPSQLLSALFLRFVGRRPLFIACMLLTCVSCLAIIFSTSDWLKVTLALSGKFGVTSSYNVMGVLEPEMFPTVLRNIAMGSSTLAARLGSVSAPHMRSLSDHFGLSPLLVFYSVISGVGALLAVFLPETRGKEIPDTVEEAERDSIELKDVVN